MNDTTSKDNISNPRYTNNGCLRLEFDFMGRSAFIAEVDPDLLRIGLVKLFSFDTATNWERLLPVVNTNLWNRDVTLRGYTDSEEVLKLAKGFKSKSEESNGSSS